MDEIWLDGFIDAWVRHPAAGSPEGTETLADLVSFMAPDVRYEDVPSGTVFVGHDGIRAMCEGAHTWSSDMPFKIVSRQTNGRLYAFDRRRRGPTPAPWAGFRRRAASFVLRGVSVGSVDADGLPREHRDYWGLGSFLTQIGVLPAQS